MVRLIFDFVLAAIVAVIISFIFGIDWDRRSKMPYTTQAEFEDKMRIIFRDYGNDPEMFHRKADELMCETLKGLGYETGVKVFENQKKWYA